MLKRVGLGLLTAWAAFGFFQEMGKSLAAWDGRERGMGRGPQAWRFGAPEPASLARCLDGFRPLLPAGGAVAFATPDQPAGIRFQRWRWAAYLLPAHDVIPAEDPAAALTARFAIAYRTAIDDPRVEPLRRLPECQLYRVKRP
ncbi:MAG: hypothetical protein ACJ75H_09855 [Thermoanaerobaculia bacterium]